MIKNYLQLNNLEMSKAYEFITRNEEQKKALQDIEKQLKNEVNNFGEGTLFLFKKETIIAKVTIVLKEAKEIGTAYIIGLDISEDTEEKIDIIKEIVKEATNIARNYGATEIYFGTDSKQIVKLLKEYNINEEYLAIIMKLNDDKIKYRQLKLKELSHANKLIYKEIYNDIFKYIPNGATITERELEENIKLKDNNNEYFIVMNDENIDIGILDISIKDKIGSFDLGLKKEFRNKGYGKRLLETAIEFLSKKENVEEINLLVISKNKLAYEMYKKRGFEDKYIFSYWYEVKDLI